MTQKVRWSTDPNVVQTIAQDSFGGWEQAINEAVKNSLDANATRIEIRVPSREIIVNLDEQNVVVEDNGDGMTLDELGDSYCRFGRYKPNHRGTGKVATFKVARDASMETWRDGKRHSIQFATAAVLSAKTGEFPESEVATADAPAGSSGTRLTLSCFRDDTSPPSISAVHHVLLRNFHHRSGITFIVNGDEFRAEDHASEALSVEEVIEGVGNASLTVLLAKPRERLSNPGVMVCAGGQTIHGPDLFGLDAKGYRGDAEKTTRRILGRLDLQPDDDAPIESGAWTISGQYGAVREWAGQHLEGVVDAETRGVVDDRVEKWLQDPPTRRFYEKLAPNA